MAGYIGDNFVWKEQGVSGNWSFFVLSGTNRCPKSKPWCGYADPDASAQAILFRCVALTLA